MELKDKDILRGLFSAMTDEPLPFDFNEKVMARIRHEALLREKRKKRLEIFGYISGVVASIAVCVIVFYITGFSFRFPEINLPDWSSLRPELSFREIDYSIFSSQPFKFSVFIGTLGLILIIIDSLIRRHIGKTGHK